MKEYQERAISVKLETSNNYCDAQHAGFGLMTEVGELLDTYKRHSFYGTELDRKNLVEEVGDILWYIALGYHSLGKVMPEPPRLTEAQVTLNLDFLLGKFARNASNFFAIVQCYPDCWDDNYLDIDLNNMLGYLKIYVEQELDTTLEAVAQANIEKLAKRYNSGKFTQRDALNRDVDNELSHING